MQSIWTNSTIKHYKNTYNNNKVRTSNLFDFHIQNIHFNPLWISVTYTNHGSSMKNATRIRTSMPLTTTLYNNSTRTKQQTRSTTISPQINTLLQWCSIIINKTNMYSSIQLTQPHNYYYSSCIINKLVKTERFCNT